MSRIGIMLTRTEDGKQVVQMYEKRPARPYRRGMNNNFNLLVKPMSQKEALELGLLLIRNSQ